MDYSNLFVVFILLVGASALGFIAAWFIRQARIDALEEALRGRDMELRNKDDLLGQYHVDRELLQEEVKKYKKTYDEQLAKTQRLHENIRLNQYEIEDSQIKINELSESLVKAEQEIEVLKKTLTTPPKSPKQVVRVHANSPESFRTGSLSLLGKMKGDS